MWNKSYKWSWSDKMISASEVTVSLHLSLEENHQDLNTVTSKTKQDPKNQLQAPHNRKQHRSTSILVEWKLDFTRQWPEEITWVLSSAVLTNPLMQDSVI